MGRAGQAGGVAVEAGLAAAGIQRHGSVGDRNRCADGQIRTVDLRDAQADRERDERAHWAAGGDALPRRWEAGGDAAQQRTGVARGVAVAFADVCADAGESDLVPPARTWAGGAGG